MFSAPVRHALERRHAIAPIGFGDIVMERRHPHSLPSGIEPSKSTLYTIFVSGFPASGINRSRNTISSDPGAQCG
jgi:hypothetical protein